jgi:tRNA modification GTPase
MTPPSTHDTIVAIATAAGRGAIGIIRISGADAARLGVAVLGGLPPARVASLRRFLDSDGGILDEGMALYFPAPASFTGEPVLELYGHGGAVTLDRLVQRLLELGARMARPGEFTERAFLNGKLDLAQAEAVADLIDAGTAAAARAALRSLQGEFSRRVHELRAQLTELRVHVEAAIDFPDEEIDFLPTKALEDRLSRVFAAFDSIAAGARQGALLREGLIVVIAGPPNAGKSTLLNALAGEDIAIVTAVPGTTRDVLRQQVHLDGLPVNLIDTAGLREAADEVEAEGIRRARAEIERADRVLFVVDGSDGAPPEATEAPPAGVPVTRIINKIDLLGLAPRVETEGSVTQIFLSAHTGAGIALLRDHLKASAGYRDAESGAFSARRRHVDALNRARTLVESAGAVLRDTRAQELFAEDLRLAQRALGEITGEFTSDDLLGEIFSSFCIGK